MRRPADHLSAIVIALLVNAVGILLLVRIQSSAEERVEEAPFLRAVSISAATPDRRPPPPTPVPPTRTSRRPRPRLLPVPETASMVDARRLAMPDFDATRAIDPLSDELPLATNLEGLLQVEEVVDEAPRVVRRVEPQYPLSAELMGTTGRVTVRLRVSETGTVTHVEVMESDPPGVFDEATVRAIQRWRFTPAMYRGKPVPTWCRTAVVFTLAEEAER